MALWPFFPPSPRASPLDAFVALGDDGDGGDDHDHVGFSASVIILSKEEEKKGAHSSVFVPLSFDAV